MSVLSAYLVEQSSMLDVEKTAEHLCNNSFLFLGQPLSVGFLFINRNVFLSVSYFLAKLFGAVVGV